MININLLAEKKQTKKKLPTATRSGGLSVGQTVLLAGIVLIGVGATAGWWWSLRGELVAWETKHAEADAELERLADIRTKGEEYKQQKELLARKIDLITELKRRQELPVHMLDQISRNLPDFLWLDSMTASSNQITINGKATTYNAVTNFYNNLSRSGLFQDVNLGRTYEAAEGLSFSLTCGFSSETGSETETDS